MKKIYLLALLAVIAVPEKATSEKTVPVLVSSYTIDTSLYDMTFYCNCYLGPGAIENQAKAFRKKNSNQFDIYSFEGKCGTSIVPLTEEVDIVSFSRYYIDGDDGWEAECRLCRGIQCSFRIYDDDGTLLLSDSGNSALGFDGKNTYVISDNRSGTKKVWRFRTNISSSASSQLAKTRATQLQNMQLYARPDGSYNAVLSPTSSNRVNFQLFDMTGRLLYTRIFNNINSQINFTIPEGKVPSSAFIAKTDDGENTEYKKGLGLQ